MLKIDACNVNLKEGEIPTLNMGCYVRISIVSSGYSNDSIINDFDNYSFKDVIIKPYGIKELSKVINNVIMGLG
jgi:hypothetical protein